MPGSCARTERTIPGSRMLSGRIARGLIAAPGCGTYSPDETGRREFPLLQCCGDARCYSRVLLEEGQVRFDALPTGELRDLLEQERRRGLAANSLVLGARQRFVDRGFHPVRWHCQVGRRGNGDEHSADDAISPGRVGDL